MAPMIGDLDIQISDRHGEGLRTMTEFVQQHMTNILQPFANHLDELHRAVDILTTDVGQVTERALGNSDQLVTHAGLCAGLRTHLDATSALAERNCAGLEKADAAAALLEAEHGQTKWRLAAAEASLTTIEVTIPDLRRGLVLANTSVGLLQNGLHATNERLAQETRPAVAKLQEDARSLDLAHAATAKLLGMTKAASERTEQERGMFSKVYERHKREGEDLINHLTQRLADLASDLKDTNRRQETNSEHLKVTNASARSLKVRCEQLEASNRGLVSQQSILGHDFGNLTTALAGLRAEFNVLNASFGSDADAARKKNIFDTVEKLIVRVSKSASDLDQLERRVQESHGRLVKEAGRITDLDRQQDAHSERIHTCEEMIGIHEEATPMAGGHGSLHPRTSFGMDTAPTPLSSQKAEKGWSINAGQRQGLKRIDALVGEAQKNRSAVAKNESGICTLDSRLHSLETQLERQNKLLVELHAGLDLGREYWQGLSKGFRDVHRAVAIEGEILPQRGSHAATLPSRPVTRDITDEAMSGRHAATLPPLGMRGMRGPSPNSGMPMSAR